MQKAYTGKLCRKQFTSRSKLKLDTSRHHEEPRGLQFKRKTFKCGMCGYEVGKKDYLMKHMMAHTGERPFKCTAQGCGMDFKLHESLKTHINSKHSDERPFKCTDQGCGMDFKSGQMLKIHIRNRHSDERPFQCKFPGCFYAAKMSGTLTRHAKVHSDDRPLACPNADCKFRAKLRSSIKRHVKNVHSQGIAFVCSTCNYKTAREASFKYHISRHALSRDFKCSHPQCEESFKSSSDLKRHFSNRHEERKIHCDHPGCGQKFGNINALNKHKWGVHWKKRLACTNPDCSYRTNHVGNLRNHMIVHEQRNEKIPCSVEGCEYKGKNKRVVYEHMRRHGALIKCPVSGCNRFAFTKKALKDHVELHNPVRRPFQCPLCFKRYLKRSHLDLHTAAHTKEKPFRCGHCEHTTSWGTSARNHVSSVHADVKFPFIIILPLNDRQCIQCKVTLPFKEFILHSMDHMVPSVMLPRLEIKYS